MTADICLPLSCQHLKSSVEIYIFNSIFFKKKEENKTEKCSIATKQTLVPKCLAFYLFIFNEH